MQLAFFATNVKDGKLPSLKRAFVTTEGSWDAHLPALTGTAQPRSDGGWFIVPPYALARRIVELMEANADDAPFSAEAELLWRWVSACKPATKAAAWRVLEEPMPPQVPLPIATPSASMGAPAGPGRVVKATWHREDVTCLLTEDAESRERHVHFRVGGERSRSPETLAADHEGRASHWDTPKLRSLAFDPSTRRAAWVWTDDYRQQITEAQWRSGSRELDAMGELTLCRIDEDDEALRIPVTGLPNAPVAFLTHDDGPLLLFGDSDAIVGADPLSGEPRLRLGPFPELSPKRVAYSETSRVVVVGAGGLHVADLGDGAPELVRDPRLDDGRWQRVEAVYASPSGRYVVACVHQSLLVWDLEARENWTVPVKRPHGPVTFSSDERLFVAAQYGGVFQVCQLEPPHEFVERTCRHALGWLAVDSPRKTLITADGRHLICCSRRETVQLTAVMSLARGQLEAVLTTRLSGAGESATDIFERDGELWVAEADGTYSGFEW